MRISGLSQRALVLLVTRILSRLDSVITRALLAVPAGCSLSSPSFGMKKDIARCGKNGMVADRFALPAVESDWRTC